MGQIVKRKRKGRPAKADPGARDLPQAERDVRRSLRRRNVKYVFDLDDYFDEDEVFVDDEDQRRSEKKLKLLLKLQNSGDAQSTGHRDRRYEHAPATSASSSDDGGKPSKKRKIDDEMEEDMDEENDEPNEDDNYNYEDDEEFRDTKPENKGEDSLPGTPAAACGLPLPEKKTLELILDKLQRKDIYGVYAEPVDPDELPDYHDIIEHPMDFATVRNKLRNEMYPSFEQFESDVFLICSNAMRYNAPDTIYHKQARTIQELAKRKFHKLRLKSERIEKDVKPEQKTVSGSIPKKQIKRSVSRTVQEPVGSDFSSGATLATAGDIQNVPSTLQGVGPEKTSSLDVFVDGSNDNNLDKVEESLPGKGPSSRFGRRSFVQDENRRATYSISLSLPVASSESIFSTFDGETKQLVPVGLFSDHSYARSMARFAASLGSVAWKVASNRIEQALPQGFKFGQGWVGEYEPLPTPVLMLENCRVNEPPFLAKPQPVARPKKIPTVSDSSPRSKPFLGQKLPFCDPNGIRPPILSAQPIRGNISEANPPYFLSSPRSKPFLGQKLPFCDPNGIRPPILSAQPIRGNISETNTPYFLSSGIKPSGPHHQSLQSKALLESEKKVELNSPPMLNNSNNNNAADSVAIKRSSEMEASRPMDFSSKSINFTRAGSFRQPDNINGVAYGGMMPNGKVMGNRVDGGNTIASLPSDLAKPANYYPHDQQGLSDPVQLMRKLAEKQEPSNQSPKGNGWIGNDPNNAAAAAARAWMSVGSGGLRPVTENANVNANAIASSYHSSTRDMRPQFRGEFPPQAFVQGPMQMVVGNQFLQNQRMVFPGGDLSRFQVQSNWGTQTHSRQKQESLPPDLNIGGFQSSGGSSGVLIDSQQPDLALQL